MILNSDRLIFKEFQSEDFDLFFSVFSNEKTMEYALMNQYTAKEESCSYFEQILKNNKTSAGRIAYEFAVYRSDDNEFVGFADIEVMEQNTFGGCGEIGYFLLPQHWGNGYATEIAQTLCRYCFARLGMHRVSASCNVNNISSEHVMKKIGMKKEGELRKARLKDNHWDNELKYSLLFKEWESTAEQ